MCTVLFKPKVDYIFKNLFGSEKHPRILISFLNACIKPKSPIVSVRIKNSELTKEYIEDSFSRLDVLAKTDKGEMINIEMQRADEKNMVKRSLYYWSKAFSGEYGGKSRYSELPRTVCVNVLDFNLLPEKNYHNKYILKNAENNDVLTDVMEFHFIELPKMKKINPDDLLSIWTGFINDPNDENIIELESKVSALHEAKVELARMSRDPKEAEYYRLRENAMSERMNALLEAEDKGIAKGLAKGRAEGIAKGLEKGLAKGLEKGKAEGEKLAKLEIAKSLLGLISDELIVEKTG
ncbi:MAG: Rpn family recombination-promoting nuclease/putative transposase, partial [Cetobacterium sp.]